MRKEVETQLTKMKEAHIGEADAVEQWRSIGLTLSEHELLEVAEWLVQDDVFRWLSLISHILPSLASESGFLELLSLVVDRVKGDLGQGPFITALIAIGEKQPTLAEELYAKMAAESPGLLDYGGLVLGGVARADKRVLERLLTEIVQRSGIECMSFIRALRVAFEKADRLDPRVFPTLRILAERLQSEIKREVSLAYLDFYVHNKSESSRELRTLARSSDLAVRFAIADQLALRELETAHLLELIGILADDDDRNILAGLGRALATKCKDQTEFCMSIVKKWIDATKFFDISSIGWVLNEVGKANLERSLLIVKGWIEGTDGRLTVLAPDILWRLGEHNAETLVNGLLAWSEEKPLRKIALEGIRKVLSEYFMQGRQNHIVDICFDSLYALATSEGLDASRISKREEMKIFKCCALIDELERERRTIDYKLVLSNLDQFPKIKSLLGLEWFMRMRDEASIEHPLLTHLSSELLREEAAMLRSAEIQAMGDKSKQLSAMFELKSSLVSSAFLFHLEQSLAAVSPRDPHAGKLRDGLKEPELFWQTFSVIDVFSRLGRKYKVELEPTTQTQEEGITRQKRPDLMVTVNSDEVLIEVITPEMFPPLKYFGRAGIPNRLRSKVYTEFKEHFKGQVLERHVIIVVDKMRSEIDYYSAEDYLEGSMQLTLRIDRTTGRVIESFPSRADDAMHMLDPDTRVIIGLVIYRKTVGTDWRIHLRGRSFVNECVADERRRKMLSAIADALLG